MSKPPVVATWLVLRLATHRSNEALVGDLTEEFQRRPSRSWYWRQVVVAVLVSWWSDVRAHKRLTLRALALGWALLWLSLSYLVDPLTNPGQWLFERGLLDHLAGWSLPWMSVRMLVACSSYWLVGRFHRPPMVVVFFASMLLWWDVPRFPLAISAAGHLGTKLGFIAAALSMFTLFRLPMLVVGLWAARPRQARPDPVFGPVLRSW
jgi:hypothetical protein